MFRETDLPRRVLLRASVDQRHDGDRVGVDESGSEDEDDAGDDDDDDEQDLEYRVAGDHLVGGLRVSVIRFVKIVVVSFY